MWDEREASRGSETGYRKSGSTSPLLRVLRKPAVGACRRADQAGTTPRALFLFPPVPRPLVGVFSLL